MESSKLGKLMWHDTSNHMFSHVHVFLLLIEVEVHSCLADIKIHYTTLRVQYIPIHLRKLTFTYLPVYTHIATYMFMDYTIYVNNVCLNLQKAPCGNNHEPGPPQDITKVLAVYCFHNMVHSS